jgi:GNAT superfamily N-acetyltransferase
MITFTTDRRPDLDAIRALYAASPLRRPIGDPGRIRRMFEGSNVVFAAWEGGRLVGLLRGWTDGAFDGYVCDLAIHPAFQKAGVGRGLLDMLIVPWPDVRWVLLASPLAKDYYARVGWAALDNAWVLPRPNGAMPSYEAFQAEHADLAARA